MSAVDKFVADQLALLNLERDAEIQENKELHESYPVKTLCKLGICVQKLSIGSRRTGLGGHLLINFEPNDPRQLLPCHQLTPGDVVGVYGGKNLSPRFCLCSGVVASASSRSIGVAFDENNENLNDDENLLLVKLANDVTYKRTKRALEILAEQQSNSRLINVLFQVSPPSQCSTGIEVEFFDGELDESQKSAVRLALEQNELAIIHGPPGTGKTTTIVEFIRQMAKVNKKVLACAPSNVAVDNLLERLDGRGVRMIRLGHPARALAGAQRHALDDVLRRTDEGRVLGLAKHELAQLRERVRKEPGCGMYAELGRLRREVARREQAAVKQVVGGAAVVLGTLTSAHKESALRQLADRHFDVVVIDECSQAIEAASWIPLRCAAKCVLAGDHLQLPPTVLSVQAASGGLATSLMERLTRVSDLNSCVALLTVQYRMHQLIMQWSSQRLYDDRLTAHHSVASHLLSDLDGFEDIDDIDVAGQALMLIDTAGCGLAELELPDEVSKANAGEVRLAAFHVRRLVAGGLSPVDIAVIAPYNLQVELLRLELAGEFAALEIKSVDGFQGREKEAVVISLVRSNARGELGFLTEKRRINVAVTRARRHLAVICDSECVGRDPFLASLVEHLQTHGQVVSAVQILPDSMDASSLTDAARKLVDGKPRKVTEKQDKPKKKAERKQESKTKEPPTLQETPQQLLGNKEDENSFVDHTKALIERFMLDDSQTVHEFPPELNSFQRLHVHQLAGALGVCHASRGEGKSRRVVLVKKQQRPAAAVMTDKTGSRKQKKKAALKNFEKLQLEEDVAELEEDVAELECCDERRRLKSQSMKECGDTGQGAQPGKSIGAGRGKKKSRKSEKSKGQTAESLGEKIDETCQICGEIVARDNLKLHKALCQQEQQQQQQLTDDQLIASAIRSQKICHFVRCKVGTQLIGGNCQFCRLRFCLAHHLAEVHGCGDAAKKAARATVAREGKIYPGSGVPSKKPNVMRRAALERSLHAKLEKLNSERQPKNKPKNK